MKLTSPKASEEKVSSLAAKYDDLHGKLVDITKLVDMLTFETHFVLPEIIGESDQFREAMTGALAQMRILVQVRARAVHSLIPHVSTAPRTETILK